MSTVTAETLIHTELSWALVEDTYADLPFHGPHHPWDVRNTALDLSAKVKEHRGTQVDEEIVEDIGLEHDGGFAYTLNKGQYATKEVRTAKLMQHRRRFPERFIKPELWIPNQRLWTPSRKSSPVYQGTVSTQYDTPASTIEQVIGNRSDVDNVGQNYERDTVPGTGKLLIEVRYLCEDKIDYDGFRSNFIMFLGGYAAKDLFLGDFDTNDDGDLWVSAYGSNFGKLQTESEDSIREIMGEDRWDELADKYPPGEGAKKYTAEAFEKLYEPLF